MVVDQGVAHNREVIRRVFAEILNGGNLDLIEELYQPEVIDHDPLPGAPDGLEGIRYTIGGLRSAMPDLVGTIEDMSAYGDMVVIHTTWRGTFLHELAGILPPTGKVVEYSGIVIWRLENGRIAERWAMTDILQQFGVASRRARRVRATGVLGANNAVIPFVTAQLVMPGKYDAWLRFHEELRERKDEFVASRRRLGITREVAWLMMYPKGDGGLPIEIVYWEVKDLFRAFHDLAVSDDPFDVWFIGKLKELHGFEMQDVYEAGPPQLMFEWSDTKAVR